MEAGRQKRPELKLKTSLCQSSKFEIEEDIRVNSSFAAAAESLVTLVEAEQHNKLLIMLNYEYIMFIIQHKVFFSGGSDEYTVFIPKSFIRNESFNWTLILAIIDLEIHESAATGD